MADRRTVLFLGCNHPQVPYLQEILSRGFRVVGTDRNRDAPGAPLCHRFVEAGYDEIDRLLELARVERVGPDDAVFTASAHFACVAAAAVAAAAGIRWPSRKTVELSMDKIAFYRFLQEQAAPVPPFQVVRRPEELESALSCRLPGKALWLKSDRSKNPNHVFRIPPDGGAPEPPWEKDRYLSRGYVLQEEFEGEPIRVNLFPGGRAVYRFELPPDGIPAKAGPLLDRTEGEHGLRKIVKALGLEERLVKFDLIVRGEAWAVLDIGLDPPARMLADYQARSLDFYRFYVDLHLGIPAGAVR